ncbi:hypothetical protein EDC05_004195 [Coemansia umbellata]|uniref:Uncharacterized protein n=1 Tax=Coemansia umbellata TaxID=1424467 RepID=A0ABQ8PJ09_9FUNG|nr:hypothetical protein EDC05_004195 [Coemansia umbellata]
MHFAVDAGWFDVLFRQVNVSAIDCDVAWERNPAVFIPTCLLKGLSNKLQKDGFYMLSEAFIRSPATGATIPKDDETVELLVKAWVKGHICLNPGLVKRMLDWPSIYNPRTIWSNALCDDTPVHKYRPALSRTLQCTTSAENIR